MDEAMASKRTLNARNLEALGAERLAELLVEVSTGNAGVKRRIRLELASLQSPDQVAKEIRKRLSTIARSRSFVDWQNRRDLVDDLEAPRRAIVQQVAKADPTEGLDLMWRFMALANSVFTRCDDSSGTVSSIFHAACHDLGEMAQTAGAEWRSLRDPVTRRGCARRKNSARGHTAFALDDRFCFETKQGETIPARCPPPCRMCEPRGCHP